MICMGLAQGYLSIASSATATYTGAISSPRNHTYSHYKPVSYFFSTGGVPPVEKKNLSDL